MIVSMYYSLKKTLLIVLKAEKTRTKHFLFYDEDANMCCYVDWCYKTREKLVKLSELTPEYKPNISSEYYIKIKEDIINNGFDYTKSFITVKNLDIIDGHHRYFILKEIFGENHEISVLEILDRHNVILHFLFIFLFIKPIKIILKLLKLIKWWILYPIYLFLSFL